MTGYQVPREETSHKFYDICEPVYWLDDRHLSLIPGYTPALSCASSDKVADCLALILAHMMPFSPGNTTTNSSRIALALSGELGRNRTSASLDFNDGNRSRTESNADTSDSETYWLLM